MSTRTIESHICLSLVMLLVACGDGTSQMSGSAPQGGTAETGDTGDAGNSAAEGGSASMSGDAGGDAEAGSTDPTGDGDGDGAGDGDGDAGDGDPGDGDPGDGDPGDGDDDPGDGDADPTDGGAAATCGDGNVDVGEECDDGAQDNGPFFACKSDCTLNVCGDGANGPNEGCDDGNLVDGDGCSAMCMFENLNPDAILCGAKLWKCGDGIDNDMDGLVDLHDPECTTQCDDDEARFYTSLPGQNLDCKADCYFDGNSGMGNDTCEYQLECDPENPGKDTNCEYDDNAMCNDWGVDGDEPPAQSQQCHDVCMPLVPDGCDCFGCCVLDNPDEPNEPYTVYLGNGDCDLGSIDECPTCTPNDSCFDPCGDEECELCFGQSLDDLPDQCWAP